ncbi:MAG: chemotaxis response regulator protein-glutamate methylesterase [Candidatus Omnitrophica bacterium]|nr:chemotaxis response regulator protein-glutamate methylesterase [Candidatus Omnitrophota bacterium]
MKPVTGYLWSRRGCIKGFREIIKLIVIARQSRKRLLCRFAPRKDSYFLSRKDILNKRNKALINVIIADDSPFLRNVLKDVLEASNQIKVVHLAKNGKEAVELVKTNPCDILILDCEMPVMNGLDALKQIMAEKPLPVFMFSAYTSKDAAITLQALEYGAVDFLQKPSQGAHALEEVSEILIGKLVTIAEGKRKMLAGLPSSGLKTHSFAKACDNLESQKNKIDIIAVGSSTGGVHAATDIIKKLPEHTKPILWVQHLPPSFTKGFAERLNSLTKIKVVEAEDGIPVKDDHCYIAKGGVQMSVARKNNNLYLHSRGTEKVTGHCPSCNVLFESLSNFYADNILGVVLTGMGEDGSQGLLSMHKKGALVIGQNEESCVVYGMPRAAKRLGAVDIEMSLNEIGDCLSKLADRTKKAI